MFGILDPQSEYGYQNIYFNFSLVLTLVYFRESSNVTTSGQQSHACTLHPASQVL